MLLRIGFIFGLVALYVIGALLTTVQEPAWVVPALMGAVFVALVVAMYVRVLPALLALPVLAIALASIAGMKWNDIFTTVVQDGSMRLSTAIIAALMGAILAQVVEKTGIAQTAIKKTAELGGDRPGILAVLLTIVVALLFTTLGGLGAVIMVATIVIPILLSLGLRPLYVGCLFLLAMSLGGTFNVANWALYKDTLGMNVNQIVAFALPFFAVMLVAVIAFLAIEGKRLGKARYKAELSEDQQTTHAFVPWYALLTPIIPLIPVMFFALLPRFIGPKDINVTFPSSYPEASKVIITKVKYRAIVPFELLKYFVPSKIIVGMISYDKNSIMYLMSKETTPISEGIYIISVNQQLSNLWNDNESIIFQVNPSMNCKFEVTEDNNGNLKIVDKSTLIPGYDFPIVVALLLGIIYGAITTWRRGTSTVQLLTKASFDGVSAVGPALILMVGIGMVLKATMAPEVSGVISPLLAKITPGTATGPGAMLHYVLLFTILAPLALYRGPLNLWGMGAGLVGALQKLMPGGALMGAFMSVGMIQGVCDPTNTHNVWIANYTNTDVQDILKRTLPYMWVVALAGLVLAAVIYYR